MKLYTTLDEAINREIVAAIEATGVVKDAHAEYDIDAIADEVLEYVDGYEEERNAYNLNRQGFRLREDIDHDEFWDAVAKHEA
ncbi:hypothetical protein QP868_02355 [Brevibacterium sp. UMB1308A]|uniref:hypothetical protein n=1 Tax=Brevibacterium sp. UMB1308A TaxID=3050608 RepID=UPI00254A13DD|nr:hypothetical protein [Brevibacterium sp. UMB1308A]MDK8345411.1 hypothetical protein [Brevibacterium sp. UMB1308B]MDK8712741.1 hypothetical protein [Brevibacterium sp. UMB1308A]